MFAPSQYELLDFGAGRKLERFGRHVIDRPCPVAERIAPRHTALWSAAEARYHRIDAQVGTWEPGPIESEHWTIKHNTMVLQLSCGKSGAIGVFPEQAENWDWIGSHLRRSDPPPTVLNLFAYTGGSTLAAAAAGARVTHVDAARSVVARARRNAEHSGLADAPIRWIVEDARRFAQRERKRGRRYDAVILDPPSYGHGPRGRRWQLDRHLPELLSVCRELLSDRPRLLLLTCHSPQWQPQDLEALLADRLFGNCASGVRGRRLFLRTADGRRLPSGQMARWSSR